MTILDKHPAPWRKQDGSIVSAKGESVFSEVVDSNHDPEALPLVLSAPLLLASLKKVCAGYSSEWHDTADGTSRSYPRELRAAERLICLLESGKALP